MAAAASQDKTIADVVVVEDEDEEEEDSVPIEGCQEEVVEDTLAHARLRALSQASGVVYSWGNGGNGQLGLGDTNNQLSPQVVVDLGGLAIRQVSCGRNHSVALTEGGDVFSWGWGDYGQLGLGDTNYRLHPCKITKLAGVEQVNCGGDHTLALDRNQRVLAWGRGGSGQLGVGSTATLPRPTEVDSLEETGVCQVACGGDHSVCLTQNCEVYTFGSGDHGQLGHGSTQDETFPCLVTELAGKSICCISCGGYHTLALTNGGDVWCMGWNKYGQVGVGESMLQDISRPRLVTALSGLNVSRVAGGWAHSIAISASGDVFTWGYGGNGQLGHGDTTDECKPRLVEALRCKCVLDVGYGRWHTLCVTRGGKVYSWGWSGNGQLGHCNTAWQLVPRLVEALKEKGIRQVAAGWTHSMALTTRILRARSYKEMLNVKAKGLYTRGMREVRQRAKSNIEHHEEASSSDEEFLVPPSPEDVPLSVRLWKENDNLGYEDKVESGFYDMDRSVPGLPTLDQLKKLPLDFYVRETTWIDPTDDPGLVSIVERMDLVLQNVQDPKQRIRNVAAIICASMGGEAKDELFSNTEAEIKRLKTVEGCNAIPLGGMQFGMCRHRSLLFKYCSDLANIPCRLIRGAFQRIGASLPFEDDGDGSINHYWAAVRFHEHEYFVDLLYEPGELYARDSPKYKMYHAMEREPGKWSFGGRQSKMPSIDPECFWEVDFDEVKIEEKVGRGQFGVVFKGMWRGTQVAVKKLLEQNEGEITEKIIGEFRKEVRVLSQLRHPHVVLFLGACSVPPNMSILTEFLARGSLFRILHRSTVELPWKRRLKFATDAARGINYLHSCNPVICHRDLKSGNLLVDRNWNLKVCDFGLSRTKEHTFVSTMHNQVGTPAWMAPEVIRNERNDEKADVYSFGVILWEIVTRSEPWAGCNPIQIVAAVGMQNQRLPIPEACNPQIAQLIQDCFDADPALRPSFDNILGRLESL